MIRFPGTEQKEVVPVIPTGEGEEVGQAYLCDYCEGETFVLFDDGMVVCANPECGEAQDAIEVVEDD